MFSGSSFKSIFRESIKPHNRDLHGRFLSKDAIVFQEGYGFRAIVDEYGSYLQEKLKEVGISIDNKEKSFSKVWLTHDVDNPFRYYSLITVAKQWIKNLIKRGEIIKHPLRKFFHIEEDFYYTFPELVKYDNNLKNSFKKGRVESVYFLIARGGIFTKSYCNFSSKKFRKLVDYLKQHDSIFGLHLSYEAGRNSKKIKTEFKKYAKKFNNSTVMSRHHYLKWTEPQHVEEMEKFNITDDFTMAYADSIGFRVGTSKPYRFINPINKRLTNVIIHPTQIMECSLNREEYMNLSFGKALESCKIVIDQVYKHSGELVLLWHNNSLSDGSYHKKLYLSLFDYINQKNN